MSVPPSLVIAFNRPSHLEQTLESLVSARIERVWIHLDGPRPTHPSDIELVSSAKNIAQSFERRFTEFHLVCREENLGCKFSPISAINWFFSAVDMGIIIEDDILVSSEFVRFAQHGLEKYKKDMRIWQINGWTPFEEGEIAQSPWISRYPVPWGWATWRDRWQRNLFESNYVESISPLNLETIRESKYSPDFEEYWRTAFAKVSAGFDTWDYQWFHEIWRNGGFVLAPPFRLTSNFGFGESATHTQTPVGRATGKWSENKRIDLSPNDYLRNMDLDLALDKLMFGMDFPEEKFASLSDSLTPLGIKNLTKIILTRFSGVALLKILYNNFTRIAFIRVFLRYFVKIVEKSSPTLKKMIIRYRSRAWFE